MKGAVEQVAQAVVQWDACYSTVTAHNGDSSVQSTLGLPGQVNANQVPHGASCPKPRQSGDPYSSNLKKIAASDLVLSENLAESKRTDCVIRWLGDLVQPFDSVLSDSPQSTETQKLEPLIRDARDEIVALLKRREALQPARIKELKDRSAARKMLENEIQTTRRDQLAKLTGVGA